MAMQRILLRAEQGRIHLRRHLQDALHSFAKILRIPSRGVIHQSVRVVKLRIERTAPERFPQKIIVNLCECQPRFEEFAIKLRKPEAAGPASDVADDLDFVAEQGAQEIGHLQVGVPQREQAIR